MDFFWCNVFEYFKERRVAGIFFSSLLILSGLLLAGAVIYQMVGPENLRAGLAYASPVMALLFLGWVWRTIVQARARRRDRYRSSPLSGDELRKARSKLMSVKR